ncbi:MAG TPA: hypothetical protein DDZ88_31445 [Verrucomicrobiales bacterium]|nr:hypothetical protein [Verrucomicrobiales bacterium]
MCLNLVFHLSQLCDVTQGFGHRDIFQVQADGGVARSVSSAQDDINPLHSRSICEGVQVTAFDSQIFNRLFNGRPLKLNRGENDFVHFLGEISAGTATNAIVKSYGSTLNWHFILPCFIHLRQHFGTLLVISSLEILHALAFRIFHATSCGAVVGINPQHILVARYSIIIFAQFNVAIADKQSFLHLVHIFDMLSGQSRGPAVRVIQLSGKQDRILMPGNRK